MIKILFKMIKLNWRHSLFSVLAIAVLFFTACEQDEGLDQGHLEDQVQNFMGAVSDMGQQNNIDSSNLEVLCFEFVFPITVLWPEGDTRLFNNEDTLWLAVDQWYDNNPNSEEDPELVFPITVVLEDGTEEVIQDDEELCDLYYECYEDWEDEEEWEDDEEEEWEEICPEEILEACFDVVFPISIDIDGTVFSVQSFEEADSLVYAVIDTASMSYEYDIELVFPIDIILDDSLQTQLTIQNEEELEEQLDICFEAYDDELCFDIHYPITLVLPDGTMPVVNSDEEAEDVIDAFEDANPDNDEDIYPLFPITVTLEDGAELVVNDAEALEDLLDTCYDDYDDEFCFDIQYPITLILPDGTSPVVNSDEEMDQVIEAFEDANPDNEVEIYPQFPITVTLDDGSQRSVGNAEELEALFDTCD